MRIAILVLMGGCGCLVGRTATAGELPESPRIDSVVMCRAHGIPGGSRDSFLRQPKWSPREVEPK
jgi:hypothetical protein